jgi:hypothetical protein
MSDLPAPPKARRGCFFYGCLAGILCLTIMLAAVLLGLHQLKKMLNQYTDTQPMALPEVQMSREQMEQVVKRVGAFRDAVQAERPTPRLALTADEINAVIATDPNFQPWHGKLYVSIEGNLVKGRVSVPLADVGLSRFRGRYLNGEGVLAVSLQDGRLHVTAEQILVKGRSLPGAYMDAIRKTDLAAGAQNNPDAAAALGRLDSIQVQDGKLVIVPKKEE